MSENSKNIPMISVAMAAYCGEKYIAGQLQSLLEQKMVPDEIVICDDSPDDATEEAVKQFLPDARIRYFRNGEQLGICRNFEKAISLCKGDIIFLCDQDDVWLPEKIERMVQALEAAPRYDGVFCDSYVVDSMLKPQGFTHWQMRKFTPAMKKAMSGNTLRVMLKRIPAAAHNIAFRRRALSYLMPFPELAPFYADTWVALQTALHRDFGMVPEALTLYRVHEANASLPRMAGIVEQLKLSRKARNKNSIGRTVELAEEMISRMPSDIDRSKTEGIKGFLCHYRRRRDFSKNWFVRMFQVALECCRGGYHRYSNGWKSAAADIFLN